MLVSPALLTQSPLRQKITDAYHADEAATVANLMLEAQVSEAIEKRIQSRAISFIEQMREAQQQSSGIDAFLHQYNLSSHEGLALMCLAEALLRIPDTHTVNLLIQDKLTSADWHSQLSKNAHWFVKTSTWSLILSSYLLKPSDKKNIKRAAKNIISRLSEPVIRLATRQMMRVLGNQFVLGETIEKAMTRAEQNEKKGYRHSYDMLGEAARTYEDADRYYRDYESAIHAIGKKRTGKTPIDSAGISIKLSALHPRYEFANTDEILQVLTPKLKALAMLAASYNIGFTIDAEETDRLDLSLDLIQSIFCDHDLSHWEGFGLALQAYQKRAFYVLDYLRELALTQKKKIMIRLVKGAYWDGEIKRAQELGFKEYPVFTRKPNTDISYLACAKKMLANRDVFYCQFASHNAYTAAAILELAGEEKNFEFQCLHGMGTPLYSLITENPALAIPCRIYAPVGYHQDLLPYLVRRLLENGANSSFVNRIYQPNFSAERLAESPIALVKSYTEYRNSAIPLPVHLYGETRDNSGGFDLSDKNELRHLIDELALSAKKTFEAKPTIATKAIPDLPVCNPANPSQIVGLSKKATDAEIAATLDAAQQAFPAWSSEAIENRAQLLEKVANYYEAHQSDFLYLLIYEAGKTLSDAISEVREAIDFCRYYAAQARKQLITETLQGPTGESNQLELTGKGVVACISPWNFPLAIFTGQITAALVTGNTVIAKPSEQTPLIGALAVNAMHSVGIPQNVIQLLPGSGSKIGAILLSDARIKAVMFTGSTETARIIQEQLAKRNDGITCFIAETGGQNAMIVDSSALLEQAVMDVIRSAFGSAGQRCSALRVLYLQEEIADKFIGLLQGAMQTLVVNNPAELRTDVGPVIDKSAQSILLSHIEKMKAQAKLIAESPCLIENAFFVKPTAFEITSIKVLEREVFGPVLHIVRYKAKDLDRVIDDINGTGYGLTFGIHSRIDATIRHVIHRIHAGNIYVNRTIIGAVVGVQPFGGNGLSGTGPKAGGPHSLIRLCNEKTICINTAAVGGNTGLLASESV